MAEFNLWLLLVGIVAGAAVTWLVVGTISRNDDDMAATERASEAAWIARTVEEHGGRAPIDLVEQILLLHRRYLQGRAGAPLPEPETETADEPAEASESAEASLSAEPAAPTADAAMSDESNR